MWSQAQDIRRLASSSAKALSFSDELTSGIQRLFGGSKLDALNAGGCKTYSDSSPKRYDRSKRAQTRRAHLQPFRPEPSGAKLNSVLMLAYSSSLHKANNASSVKKALQLFTKPEKLEGDNKYKCFR